MNQNLKKNMLWNAAGNVVYLIGQWAVTILVTRLGGYGDAGQLSLAMSISSIFQTIAIFGIRNFQVSDTKNEFSDDCYVALRIITSFSALVMCVVFSLINAYPSKKFIAILFYMIYRLAEDFSDVLHGIAQKNERLDIAGKSFAIKGVLTVIAFLTGYHLTKSLNFALALMAALSMISTICFDIPLVRRLSDFKFYCEFDFCMNLAKKAIPLCTYQFVSSALYSVPKYMLEKVTDEASLGIYSSIFAPALLIQAAASYLYAPFVTEFARLNSNKDYKAFNRLAMKIIGIMLIALLVVLACAAVFGEWGLSLLFGDGIIEYTYLLFPIIIAVFVSACFVFVCTLEIIIRDFKGLTIGSVSGLVLAVISTPFLISWFGLDGTSYSLIVSCLVSMIISFVFLLKTQKKGD